MDLSARRLIFVASDELMTGITSTFNHFDFFPNAFLIGYHFSCFFSQWEKIRGGLK